MLLRELTSGHRLATVLRLAPMVALTGVLALGQPVLGDAAAGNYFSLSPGDCSIGGVTKAASASVHVKWRKSNGSLKLSQTVTSHHHLWRTRCIGGQLTVGDKLKMVVGHKKVKLTVPAFTINANRVTDAVSGKAPATGSAYLFLTHRSSPSAQIQYDAIVSPNGSGHYSHDFTANGGFWGGDDVFGYWSDAKGNNISVDVTVPQVVVLRGSSSVQGYLKPNSSATILLKKSSGAVRGTAHVSNSFGAFFGHFTKGGGGVKVKAGNKIDGTAVASDALLTVPDVLIAGTPSTRTISGKCQANASWSVTVQRVNGSGQYSIHGVAGGSGTFSMQVSPSRHLKHGDKLTVWCWQSTGDQIGRTGTV